MVQPPFGGTNLTESISYTDKKVYTGIHGRVRTRTSTSRYMRAKYFKRKRKSRNRTSQFDDWKYITVDSIKIEVNLLCKFSLVMQNLYLNIFNWPSNLESPYFWINKAITSWELEMNLSDITGSLMLKEFGQISYNKCLFMLFNKLCHFLRRIIVRTLW
jgi:hypothetical protein